MNHPNVHAPWQQWSEDQTLHLAVVYSNPFRWQSRRKHFNDCLHHLKQTPNVACHTVELAYGDRPFEVTDSTDPLAVQLRTDTELFHKENLINIGVSRFPAGWKYGGYSDGDFHFTRHDWALEAIHMLQHHEFVQLFSNYSDLTAATPTSYDGHRQMRSNSSFAWNYLHQQQFKAAKVNASVKAGGVDPYYGQILPATAEFPFGFGPGAPGGAWAWRQSAFNSVGGMLDTCVMGSGDWWMAFGLIGQKTLLRGDNTIRSYNDNIRNWQARAKTLTANIGCVDNFATHFYHGASKLRAYGSRESIMYENQFDPQFDITKDWQGVYRWTGNKPKLRDAVRKYFLERHEDDPSPHVDA